MIPVSDLYDSFKQSLVNKVGFNGFDVKKETLCKKV